VVVATLAHSRPQPPPPTVSTTGRAGRVAGGAEAVVGHSVGASEDVLPATRPPRPCFCAGGWVVVVVVGVRWLTYAQHSPRLPCAVGGDPRRCCRWSTSIRSSRSNSSYFLKALLQVVVSQWDEFLLGCL